jgi:hypothetical protein
MRRERRIPESNVPFVGSAQQAGTGTMVCNQIIGFQISLCAIPIPDAHVIVSVFMHSVLWLLHLSESEKVAWHCLR